MSKLRRDKLTKHRSRKKLEFRELIDLLKQIANGTVTDIDACRQAIRDTDEFLVHYPLPFRELQSLQSQAVNKMVRGELPGLKLTNEQRVTFAGDLSRFFSHGISDFPTSLDDDS